MSADRDFGIGAAVSDSVGPLRRAINAGADIAGTSFGAVAGFLLGGPVGVGVGAAAGAFLGHSLRTAGEEICRRHLSPREEKRLGAVVAAAAVAMQEKLMSGQKPRTDGFFDAQPDGRSSGDEVAEGVLLVAQREHEERKIEFMGRLLANIAFDTSVDRAQANYLIKLADQLSYTQLCIIHFLGTKADFELRSEDYPRPRSISLQALMQEIWLLYTSGLITLRKGFLINYSDLKPANVNQMLPAGVGSKLHHLMELSRLPRDDVRTIERLLLLGVADFSSNQSAKL